MGRISGVNYGMNPEARKAEIAETLYQEWSADKLEKCLRRQLCRMAKALCALGEGVLSELGDESGGDIVERVAGKKFVVKPANQVIGQNEPRELPTADEFAELLQGHRQAKIELKERREEAASL